MQAKERFYHKRKAMKQQKNFGQSNTKKQPLKFNKRSKRTTSKQNNRLIKNNK